MVSRDGMARWASATDPAATTTVRLPPPTPSAPSRGWKKATVCSPAGTSSSRKRPSPSDSVMAEVPITATVAFGSGRLAVLS